MRADVDRKIEVAGHSPDRFMVGRFDVSQVVRQTNKSVITTCCVTVHLRSDVERSGAITAAARRADAD